VTPRHKPPVLLLNGITARLSELACGYRDLWQRRIADHHYDGAMSVVLAGNKLWEPFWPWASKRIVLITVLFLLAGIFEVSSNAQLPGLTIEFTNQVIGNRLRDSNELFAIAISRNSEQMRPVGILRPTILWSRLYANDDGHFIGSGRTSINNLHKEDRLIPIFKINSSNSVNMQTRRGSAPLLRTPC
jgi:hypothetical protein